MVAHIRHVHSGMSRRKFIGVGGAALAGSVAAVGLANPAKAAPWGAENDAFIKQTAMPKPIPATVPTGLPPEAAPFDVIHWLLPGPTDAVTPVLGLPGFGLDVDPSLITDFKGFTAYAVIAGQSTGNDGQTYATEVDLRVMKGNYVGEDGEQHFGTFGFF